MLLFADDLVIFTTNVQSLQAQLDSLYVHSVKWSPKIKVKKSNILVFKKRKTKIDNNCLLMVRN
jgi:hypothetical protein